MAKRITYKRDARQQKLIDALLQMGARRMWEMEDKAICLFTLEAWQIGASVVIFQLFYARDGVGEGWAVYYPSTDSSMDGEIARLEELAKY